MIHIEHRGERAAACRPAVALQRPPRPVPPVMRSPITFGPGACASLTCYVVPSIYEPFGMVALEAAAAGTPVAVADTGGLAEIVDHGVTGVKFPSQNPSALAASVGAVLADREYARTLARRARRRVREDFAWPQIAGRTVAVYAAARAHETGVTREAERLVAASRRQTATTGAQPSVSSR